MSTAKIAPAEVTRDEYGQWWHPDLPDWEEGTPGTVIREWISANGLEISNWVMEDMEDPKAYEKAMAAPNGPCSVWNPEPPEGEGWFLLGICDTENGPSCTWVRHIDGVAA